MRIHRIPHTFLYSGRYLILDLFFQLYLFMGMNTPIWSSSSSAPPPTPPRTASPWHSSVLSDKPYQRVTVFAVDWGWRTRTPWLPEVESILLDTPSERRITERRIIERRIIERRITERQITKRRIPNAENYPTSKITERWILQKG
jgi:hypothetical protein